MTSPPDRRPTVRFRIKEAMIVTAVLAVAMAVARWDPGLGVLVLLVALVYPLLDDGRSRWARPDIDWVLFVYIAGVVSPFLCLYYDPIVFQGYNTPGLRFLRPIRLSCYGFMASEMVLLWLWLWLRFGEGLGRLRPAVAGALWVGAVFAALLGLVMTPLSLIGVMFFGLGLLGLMPFLAAYVFACEACHASPARGSSSASLGLQLAGAALAVGLLIGAHLLLDR